MMMLACSSSLHGGALRSKDRRNHPQRVLRDPFKGNLDLFSQLNMEHHGTLRLRVRGNFCDMVDSPFPILFNHRSFQQNNTAAFPGFPEVF